MTDTIQRRWKILEERIAIACGRAKRTPSEVRICAVSKTKPVEDVFEAFEAGARVFGENYVQEALPKITALDSRWSPEDRPEWHFVGALQSNKAKQVVGSFDLIHSLDRWSLAKTLERERKKQGVAVRVLVEVNVAGEQTKSGLPPTDLKPFLEKVSAETEISVEGLMVFPPLTEEPEESRKYFAVARELAERAASWGLPRVSMKQISMGVTSDFEVAIEEGATLVRVGTALFGPREPKSK